MVITQSEWDNYISLLRTINEKAAADIVTYMRNRLLNGQQTNDITLLTDEQRNELIDYAYEEFAG